MRQTSFVVVALMMLAAATAQAQTTRPAADPLDVRSFGATGDGKTKDTAAIQKAIDAATANGSGTVRIPPGAYLCGTIFLRSNVTVQLDRGALILGSTDHADYPRHEPPVDLRQGAEYCERSLIAAMGVHDAALVGEGAIDGRGGDRAFNIKANQAAGMSNHDATHIRPYGLAFVKCSNITVRGLTLRNAAFWMQTYLDCENVTIEGLTIRNRANGNNDGIDIDGSRRVRISNCDISSGDDALCLKSLYKPCEDIVVSNCILTSSCNGFKCGTASIGGFKNITVQNVAVCDTRLAGIALEIVDGGAMENVVVSGVTMRNVGTPIFIRLGDRGRVWETAAKKPPVGTLRQIIISDVTATATMRSGKPTHNPVCSSITGLPGHPVRDVTLSNIHLTYQGGGEADKAISLDSLDKVPEKAEAYPEAPMFGEMPAYGLYCRHVDGLALNNVQVNVIKEDCRPAVTCDDVKELDITALRAQPMAKQPAVVFKDVSSAMIRACRASAGTEVFLHLRGKCDGIFSTGNDLRRSAKAHEYGEGTAAGAVLEK